MFKSIVVRYMNGMVSELCPILVLRSQSAQWYDVVHMSVVLDLETIASHAGSKKSLETFPRQNHISFLHLSPPTPSHLGPPHLGPSFHQEPLALEYIYDRRQMLTAWPSSSG